MGSGKHDQAWLRRSFARLSRALDPEAAQDREQLRALLRAVREWRTQDELKARDLVERLRTVEASGDVLRRDAAASQRQLVRVRQLMVKQRELLAKFVRRAGVDQRAVEAEQRVTERLARLSRTRLPIIVGPWTGEVGFELLYWIPFLQWVRETFPIDPDRLIILSRGGVRAWYGHVSPQYEDIFQYATAEQFRAVTEERKKQQRISRFDRVVVKAVLRARGIGHAHLLHPTLMYSLFNSFWRYSTTVKGLESFSRFRVLPPVDQAIVSDTPLPDRFVAVRFYFSDCFPDTVENRRLAARVVDGLSNRGHVVLLNSDVVVDDHRDFLPERGSHVHVLSARMRPETNLALQTAAISRATAFVGTYGGYSYLAPLYGVSSVAFYSRNSFKEHHLEVAHRACRRIGSARLVPVDVRQAELLADALAGVVSTPVGP